MAVYGVLFLDWNVGTQEHKPFQGVCGLSLNAETELMSLDTRLVLRDNRLGMDKRSSEATRAGECCYASYKCRQMNRFGG